MLKHAIALRPNTSLQEYMHGLDYRYPRLETNSIFVTANYFDVQINMTNQVLSARHFKLITCIHNHGGLRKN